MKDPNRVAIVSPFFPTPEDPVTGSFVLEHARSLASHGWQVDVLAPVPLAPWPLSEWSRFSAYARTPRRHVWGQVGARYPRYVRPPGRWFRAYAGAAMARAVRRECSAHELLVAHTLLPGGHAALAASNWGAKPVVTMVHGSDVFQHALESAATRRVARRVIRRSAAVVAVSDALSRAVSSLAEPVESLTVHNGVDADLFVPLTAAARRAARAELGVNDEPTVLFVGLDPARKGLDVLLEASRRLLARGVAHQLVVVGPEAIAADAAGPHIRWMGRRPLDEMPRWSAIADVAALPSREEAFGISLLEAASCAVPVVGTRVDGIEEVVQDGVTGHLVAVNDAPALSEALEQLLLSPESRAQMGNEARARVVKSFSWSHHADRMTNVLRQVLDRHRP